MMQPVREWIKGHLGLTTVTLAIPCVIAASLAGQWFGEHYGFRHPEPMDWAMVMVRAVVFGVVFGGLTALREQIRRR